MASQRGFTALMVAAERGHSDTAEVLADRGADLEGKIEVSAAAGCWCATGRAGFQGRAG